jgi:hypothetical protein
MVGVVAVDLTVEGLGIEGLHPPLLVALHQLIDGV